MVRYIHATDEPEFILPIDQIISLVLVEDVFSFNPRDHRNSISASTIKEAMRDYTGMSREQLLALPKEELEAIHNINILRKLKKQDLTLIQQREVYQANHDNFEVPIREVKEVLKRLKECHRFFVWPTGKNNAFEEEIEELGGEVTPKDAKRIIHKLHVKDYSYSTYSYLDTNWNSLLVVFEYKGDYTFRGDEEEGTVDVTVPGLDLYVKIDMDTVTKKGLGAMSFHHPNSSTKMNHPYADYLIDKE